MGGMGGEWGKGKNKDKGGGWGRESAGHTQGLRPFVCGCRRMDREPGARPVMQACRIVLLVPCPPGS